MKYQGYIRIRGSLLTSFKERVLRRLISTLDPPVRGKHRAYSILLPIENDPIKASEYLIELALDTINAARNVELGEVIERAKRPPYLSYR